MKCAFATVMAVLGAAATAAAQDAEYRNPDLGLVFKGPYGWAKQVASGSGAWTLLATYTDEAYGAQVRLLVRDNPYETLNLLREALRKEFREGDPQGNEPGYREIAFRDAEMAEGLKLPAVEVEAVETRTVDGKKREHAVLVRVYFGANRLFRVECSVQRSRIRKVRDLFDRALAGVIVTAKDEQVVRGTPFVSRRGNWACVVPSGFTAVLPPANWNADMVFENARSGVSVYLYGYRYGGALLDHIEELQDHYRDAFQVTSDRARVMGGEGFEATVSKDDKITLISGTVRGGNVWRIHTTAPKDRLDEARRVHGEFLKGFRAGG